VNLATILEEIERDEGYRQFPYEDTATPPRLTIGHGLNLTDVGLSKEESLQIVAMRLRKIEADLKAQLRWYAALSPRRQNALVNMAYNLGLSGLLKFQKMLGAMERGDFVAAAAECLNSTWSTQVGQRAKRIAEQIREG
jgi:lysozyme